MCEPRRALVVFGDMQGGMDGAPLTGRECQVEAGGMVGTAAKALAVVAPESGARRRCVSVSLGRNRVSRGLDRTPLGTLLAHGGTLPAPRSPTCRAGCHPEQVPTPRSDGVAYRERLTPPWWGWLLAALWAATLAIAYGYAIGAVVGWLVGVGLFAIAAIALWAMSAVIEVHDDRLLAGRATLPLTVVADVRPVDTAEARLLMGTGADATAFTVTRGWVRQGVKVDLVDPHDPTPYWYVASRRPDDLAAAIDRVGMTGSRTHEK